MKRVYLLGISHWIQDHELQQSDVEVQRLEEDQKKSYGALIEELIAEHDIQFVAEEAMHGKKSVAEVVANEKSVRYRNVDFPIAERRQLGIPVSYETDRDSLSVAEGERCDGIREEHWVRSTMSEMGGTKHALLILGNSHTNTVAKRFQVAGCAVTICDLNDCSWYVENVRDRTAWPEKFKAWT